MLGAGAGNYRSEGSYPSAPMCVITLRVFVPRSGTSQQNRVIVPQSADTPLIQINVPKAPEKVALPVRYTRQAQIPEDIPSGSTPKQWHPPPAAPVVAPSIPESVPAPAPPNSKGIESTSRRSSIRRAAQQPSSSGSRSPKKVHFSISDSEDSLGSCGSDISLHDPPPPPPATLPSDSNAMAVGEKPPAHAPPSGEHDEGEPESDFSSDIDDGEMFQQAFMREPQGDNDHLYRMDWDDLDSDSGSAVDGSEPALSVPIKRDVNSRPSFATPLVSNDDGKSLAPSGHSAHLKAGEQPENATIRCLETNSPLPSGPSVPAERRPASTTHQPTHPGDWENESVVGSTIDDSGPAIRALLTSRTASNKSPISLRSAKFPFTTPGASDNAPQGVKKHDRVSTTGHATVNAPSKSPTHTAMGSSQTHPSPIFVHRRRNHQTHDVGLDGTFEEIVDGHINGHFQRHTQGLFPCTSQQRTRQVHYDRRTGTISYAGFRDGYAYVTKVRESRIVS